MRLVVGLVGFAARAAWLGGAPVLLELLGGQPGLLVLLLLVLRSTYLRSNLLTASSLVHMIRIAPYTILLFDNTCYSFLSYTRSLRSTSSW